MILYPKGYFDKVSDISLDYLNKNNIKGLILDVDNTLIDDYRNISDQTYIQDLLEKYQNEVLYDQETAYNNLDQEYRNARFGSYENFTAYANQNIIRNVKLKLSKYQINTYE